MAVLMGFKGDIVQKGLKGSIFCT